MRILTILVPSLILIACGSGGKDNSGDPTPQDSSRISTSDFRNTESKEGLQQKGGEASSYIDQLDAAGKTIAGTSRALTLSFQKTLQDTFEQSHSDCQIVNTYYYASLGYTEIEKNCEEWVAEDQKLICNVTVRQYDDGREELAGKRCEAAEVDPSERRPERQTDQVGFEDVTDCNQAFASFKETYSLVKGELDELLGYLANPAQFGLQGASLSESEADDQNALVLELTPPEQAEGMEAKGRLAGGANDRLVVLTASMFFKMDQGAGMQMPGFEMPQDVELPVVESRSELKIAADLEARLIEMFYDMSLVETTSTSISGTSNRGSVLVSAGDEQYVIEKDTITFTRDQEVFTATSEVETELVDENTLSFLGTFSTGSDSGVLQFNMVRQGDSCVIEDKSFTMPEVNWGN